MILSWRGKVKFKITTSNPSRSTDLCSRLSYTYICSGVGQGRAMHRQLADEVLTKEILTTAVRSVS